MDSNADFMAAPGAQEQKRKISSFDFVYIFLLSKILKFPLTMHSEEVGKGSQGKVKIENQNNIFKYQI